MPEQVYLIFQVSATVNTSVFFSPLPENVCVVCHVSDLAGVVVGGFVGVDVDELLLLLVVVVDVVVLLPECDIIEPMPPQIPQSTRAPMIIPMMSPVFFFLGGCCGCGG